ncbi:MAG: DegT/DnrJ/EryC1/StrS family aminotransferase [Desulfobulbaceae bacterium]|uniref:DegT/DnrJ/EryC1/StrS family aminotransferase n=1 Tax=Candidatus Desulfatifera sulfidica TaxID=2841691 RepID=A0A8J6NAR2_9BACT|nr:DegT/DnrJ/EryC1/StrS family aminotransferase [Candidatus Desulfatifera sulfidica]
MKVPLLDLHAQLRPLREEIGRAVAKVIDSVQYIQGPDVAELEAEVAAYSGVEHAVAVSSGTDALLVCLMALGVGPGDRVVTTPYSFFATMGVILRLGAEPVFCDIDPVTFNMDPDQLAGTLARDSDRRIKVILPVHLYGQCAHMAPIMALAEKYNLPVIEDAAQAIGAQYPGMDGHKWVRAGSMGLAGCFSFFPSKNLGGMGDGGMVVSRDSEFAHRVRLLRNHGAEPKYYHSLVGGNFRLDTLQAAILRIKLRHLEDWHAARRANGRYYDQLLSETDLLEQGVLSTPASVYRNAPGQADSEPNYHIFNQYVIRVQKRDELLQHLQAEGIGCEVYYPVALHQQQCLGPDFKIMPMPNSEEAAAQTLALPIYPELKKEMQEYVVRAIAAFYQGT